ncbi:MAG: 3'(2'),5'-bisphosphate nucleotidase CysQ [Myxococcota bacterium]
MTLSIELKIAEQLARQAGERALKLQHLGVARYKDNFEGPVTEGDLQADQIICEGLKQSFPDDLIISEESYVAGSLVPEAHRIWFIDPIDGTKDYAAGGAEYSVMIGLCINNQPVLGIVFEPATGILWRTDGESAERVEADGSIHSLNVQLRQISATGPTLAASHHHRSEFLDFLESSLPISKIIQKSSVGLKIALIVDGKADAYISSGRRIKLWDTCAPVAILIASGGVFKTIQGNTPDYMGPIQHGIEISAATPHASLWLADRLQKVIEQWTTLRKIKKF